ncbi:MAG: hypothetical protein ACK4YO_03610, partial [Candidatus Altarchaeaceae archaeon]
MDKRNFFMGVGIFLAVFLVINIIGNTVAASIVKIYVGEDYVNPGTTSIEIPINASISGDSLGGMTLEIFADPNVLIPDNVMDANCGVDVVLGERYVILNTSISYAKAAISCLNKTGNFTIVRIRYNISSGACGVKSFINLNVTEAGVSNFNTALIGYSLENGSVTIKCDSCSCPPGTFCNQTTHLCQAQGITCYGDADNDTYGNESNRTIVNGTCPPDYVTRPGDCNDNNRSINPGAQEIY